MLERILIREDPEISAIVARRFAEEGISVLTQHKAKRFTVDNGEKVLIAESEARRGAHRLRPAAVCGGPRGQHSRLRPGGVGHRHHSAAHGGNQRLPADDLSQHLRLRRRGGTVSVHPHRFSPGVVRVGQRPVRPVPEIPRRLFGDSLGHVYRSRGRARRAQRERGESQGDRLRSHDLQHRRPGSRHYGRGSVRLGESAHRTRQGPHPRRHYRRRARRRAHRRVHHGDEARESA